MIDPMKSKIWKLWAAFNLIMFYLWLQLKIILDWIKERKSDYEWIKIQAWKILIRRLRQQ